MFSTAQQDFLSSFIPVLRDSSLQYYVAFTNTDFNNSYNHLKTFDLVVFASDKPFTFTAVNSFKTPSEYYRFNIYTSNYNGNSEYSYDGARYECTEVTNKFTKVPFTFPAYEFVYSNCTALADTETLVLVPDILSKGRTAVSDRCFDYMPVLLGVLLFVTVTFGFIKKRWLDL